MRPVSGGDGSSLRRRGCEGRFRRYRCGTRPGHRCRTDRAGARVIFVETHTEVEAEATGFIDTVVAAFGRIDILYVNNAGMRHYQGILDTSDESWDRILGVNVKGYAFCAKAAVASMRQTGGGSIVIISSNRSTAAGGNMIEYDTTKAAVIGLTRGLAYDHAKDGIRANAISPGPVFTRFHERRAAAPRQDGGRVHPRLRPGRHAEAARPSRGNRGLHPVPGVRRVVLRHRGQSDG